MLNNTSNGGNIQMANLNSPGVSVTILDESNYTPAPTGTVPLVVVATAQNKTNPSGNVAAYTTMANAGKVFLVTSQRELVSNYGKPNFLVSEGTPVHGYELNEYGLLAAYSALGVSNAAYILRADVDLNQLSSSLTRPHSAVSNNTLWMDTNDTVFGVFQWNSSTGFTAIKQVPAKSSDPKLIVITDSTYISGGIPASYLGNPGDYAIDMTTTVNAVYYKATAPSALVGQWLEVGSTDWFKAWPAVVGTTVRIGNTNPLTHNNKFSINGHQVTISGTADGAAEVAGYINALNITGITAAATADGRLAIFNSNSVALSLTEDVGTPLANLGISALLTYSRPAFQASRHTNVPNWGSTDSNPRPTGSVWFKTTPPNNGANIVVKRYNSASDTWITLVTPIYASDADALYNLDAVSGGLNIPTGKTYIQSDITASGKFTFKLFNRQPGVTKVTGSVTAVTFTGSKSFTLARTIPNNNTMQSPVTISWTTSTAANAAADLVAAVNNAGISYVSAAIESTGAISFTHSAGGNIELVDGSGTPLSLAGFTTSTVGVRASDAAAGTLVISNWVEPTYTVSGTTPTADPADGTYWYYNNPTEYDILINDGSQWRGYKNVAVDSRGYDLTQTDPAGPLVSASEPIMQSNGGALKSGDLWIDTANFEDFPKIYRYDSTLAQWTLLDNTDHTTSDGIVFADARWAGNGSTDIITDPLPTISSLLTSDYVDADCPSYALYPRGTLLFNTRRSGMNVKEFVVNHLKNANPAPIYTNSWVSASGLDVNGVAYLGRRAQRNLVVESMISAVENSVEATEETRDFNLITAPGYPELTSALTQLNVNRKETAFILVDSPLRLSSDSNTLDAWSRNLNLATTDGETGFTSYYEYMAGYYPSGYTTDLDGNPAVVPATHMVMRSMIRSDQKSYPWFAPAGLRRGTVDNASSIGYIDAQTGLFHSIAVSNNLRDVLYNGKVNPISVLNGSGIVVYGQKTRSALTSALDRINVSRLVVYLRKQLDLIGRQYIFEPNDDVTRKEIKNQIEKELNSIKVNRGLYDYAVVCDTSNNTPDRIDRNELWVDVAIEPEKSVEFIYIPVRIKNTGAIAAGL
jgi:Phage tail sheath C-terminal domain